jgi:hypothetical protein
MGPGAKHLKFDAVRYSKHAKTRLKMLATDKHSSLSHQGVNAGMNRFCNIGTWLFITAAAVRLNKMCKINVKAVQKPNSQNFILRNFFAN